MTVFFGDEFKNSTSKTHVEIEFENEVCDDKECNVAKNNDILCAHHHHQH